MGLLYCVFLGLTVACYVPAQTYTISTYAGGGLQVNIPATSTNLVQVSAVAADREDNIFLALESAGLRVDAVTGIISLVAGDGTAGFSGDNGLPTSAKLVEPSGVAVDSAGNLYIPGYDDNIIRRVTDGVITAVAGGGSSLGDNGPATNAIF